MAMSSSLRGPRSVSPQHRGQGADATKVFVTVNHGLFGHDSSVVVEDQARQVNRGMLFGRWAPTRTLGSGSGDAVKSSVCEW